VNCRRLSGEIAAGAGGGQLCGVREAGRALIGVALPAFSRSVER